MPRAVRGEHHLYLCCLCGAMEEIFDTCPVPYLDAGRSGALLYAFLRRYLPPLPAGKLWSDGRGCLAGVADCTPHGGLVALWCLRAHRLYAGHIYLLDCFFFTAARTKATCPCWSALYSHRPHRSQRQSFRFYEPCWHQCRPLPLLSW